MASPQSHQPLSSTKWRDSENMGKFLPVLSICLLFGVVLVEILPVEGLHLDPDEMKSKLTKSCIDFLRSDEGKKVIHEIELDHLKFLEALELHCPELHDYIMKKMKEAKKKAGK
ncbi:unnamed protein product [Allacma fusca]|uniref:Uncharacterized protein n=1 Tax=Allacma fusca TaxID=39272 RepID=A0A8J2P897_9HEXA|nr:unnamed protein product [Allacma fusca]